MKNEEFNIPFIKDLIFIAMVTIILVTSAHYILQKPKSTPENTTIFTSSQSDITEDSASN